MLKMIPLQRHFDYVGGNAGRCDSGAEKSQKCPKIRGYLHFRGCKHYLKNRPNKGNWGSTALPDQTREGTHLICLWPSAAVAQIARQPGR
jgi:hypothetical protein